MPVVVASILVYIELLLLEELSLGIESVTADKEDFYKIYMNLSIIVNGALVALYSKGTVLEKI